MLHSQNLHLHHQMNLSLIERLWFPLPMGLVENPCKQAQKLKRKSEQVFSGIFVSFYEFLSIEVYEVMSRMTIAVWKMFKCGPEKTPYLDTFHPVYV